MRLTHFLAKHGLFELLPYQSAIVASEQALWRGVLDQALRDLAANNQEEKELARIWWTERGEDYRFVCESAGFNVDWLNRIFDEKLSHMAEFNLDISFLRK